MSVRIRLARGGSKKRPFHKIVVADKRAPRDGRFIEELGYYNPLLPKEAEGHFKVNVEQVKVWLAKGAEPTDRVARLLATLGLVEKPAIHEQPKKSAPKAKAQERMKEQAEKEAALKQAAEEAQQEAEQAAEAPAEEAVAEQPAEAPVEEQPAEAAAEEAPAEEAKAE